MAPFSVDATSPNAPKEFTADWWKDRKRSMSWCNNFCRVIDESFTDDPDVYCTASVVFMNKPDGTIVPLGITALKGDKFIFQYHPDYVRNEEMPPLSATLPKRAAPYEGEEGKLLPYFDNLLAEGWLGKAQAGALHDSLEDI